MEKNPKVIAGIVGLVILAVLAIVLATYMIPTIGAGPGHGPREAGGIHGHAGTRPA